jgi:hypothetical protein
MMVNLLYGENRVRVMVFNAILGFQNDSAVLLSHSKCKAKTILGMACNILSSPINDPAKI